MNSGFRILITGSTGYLGSKLTIKLVELGYHVAVLVRKTSNLNRIKGIQHKINFFYTEEVNHIFKEHTFDLIIHLAASYGRNNESRQSIIHTNILFPLQLLEFAKINKIPYFINTASSLHPLTNDYSLTKHHFHNWLEMYQSSISIYELVLEYFFGEGDDDWKFVNMIFKKLKSNSAVIPLTTCEQKRHFYYVDDVVEAYALLIKKLHYNNQIQSYHVATLEPLVLKDVVNMCKKISGNEDTILDFGSIPDRITEANKSLDSVPKANKFGWIPKFSVMEGLEKTWKNL